MRGIIAILTDFGNQDAYTAIMKGVILSINRETTIIDITNEVKPYSIISASYLLYTAWDYYPKGTVFLSVVDPGVGSSRGILIAKSNTHSKILITPDNGTVSMLVRMKRLDEFYRPSKEVMAKIKDLMPETSSTFHGRDIFSPLAALISRNGIMQIVGERTTPLLLDDVTPSISRKNPIGEKPIQLVTGRILHIDNFGNCISSIHREDISSQPGTPNTHGKDILDIKIGKLRLKKLSNYFSEVETGKPLAYIGSSGFLEIAINQGNASSAFGIKIGDSITVKNKTKA